MVHENDPERGGCEFANFFHSTPPDLIEAGLYRALAVAFVSGETHRQVSRALLAKALGATDTKASRSLQTKAKAACNAFVKKASFNIKSRQVANRAPEEANAPAEEADTAVSRCSN
jgi:hypothetical protein